MNKTFLNNKPKRIKEERKRLGLTQAQAAEKCGIKRQQWIRYEKGTSVFDGEPLRNFGNIGASVSYILSGEKSTNKMIGKLGVANGQVQKPAELSDDEWQMIHMYRSMNQDKKEIFISTAKVFANNPSSQGAITGSAAPQPLTNSSYQNDNSNNSGYINQGNQTGDVNFGG